MTVEKYTECPKCDGDGHNYVDAAEYDDDEGFYSYRRKVYCRTCKSTGSILEADYLILKLKGKV